VLRAALTKYTQSLEALTDLKKSSSGEAMLVPLTGSMYVPGKITNVDKVMVELGTGYFVEKKTDAAIVLIKGKLSYLQKNIDQLAQVIVQKKKQLTVVSQVIQQRVQVMQARQQDAQAAAAQGNQVAAV
jgi:prefoldin alpha subunit